MLTMRTVSSVCMHAIYNAIPQRMVEWKYIGLKQTSKENCMYTCTCYIRHYISQRFRSQNVDIVHMQDHIRAWLPEWRLGDCTVRKLDGSLTPWSTTLWVSGVCALSPSPTQLTQRELSLTWNGIRLLHKTELVTSSVFIHVQRIAKALKDQQMTAYYLLQGNLVDPSSIHKCYSQEFGGLFCLWQIQFGWMVHLYSHSL